MTSRLCAAALLGAVSCALALGGCGESASRHAETRVTARHLTIYSGLPLLGPSRSSGQAVLNGERMALAQAGAQMGRYRIMLRSLDDATLQRSGWDPGQTTANAKLAAQDPTTIGYIGDLNSGATAVAIPLLNQGAVPQVSPLSTAVGLTRGGLQAAPGEPEKYYPSGRRTLVRVVATDAVQSSALVAMQRQAGCRAIYVLEDGEDDGHDAAESYEYDARVAGLSVVGDDQFNPKGRSYAALGRALATKRPDCVVIAALTQEHAVAVASEVGRSLPEAQLFAISTLAEPTFFDPAAGGVPAALDPRLTLIAPALPASAYPPAGRRFVAAYVRAYGAWQPDAIFGCAAMQLMLDAIRRATDGGRRDATRASVLAALFHTRSRASVLGTFSITPSGDTSLQRVAAYRVDDGRLVFLRAFGG